MGEETQDDTPEDVAAPALADVPEGLWPKILWVQTHADQIVKTGHMDAGGSGPKYAYMQEHALIELLQPLCNKAGLLVLVDAPKRVRNGNSVDIDGRLTIIDTATGEQTERFFPAEGTDRGDKGTPKALTQLSKYALQKTFLVATEVIDADNDPSRGNERKSAEELAIPKAKLDELVNRMQAANIDPAKVKAKVRTLGKVDTLKKLPADRVADFEAWLSEVILDA